MSEVKFLVLGPVDASLDGTPVNLTGPTALTILAGLLVSANYVVTSEKLIDWVWPGRRPGNPKAALQNAISRLRKVIGEDSVTTVPRGYVLRADSDRLDLVRFRTLHGKAAAAIAAGADEKALALLDEAIGLWDPPVLANVRSEILLRDTVPHLTEHYLRAVEQRAALRLRLMRPAGLPEELAELVREHPLRETLIGHLMVALFLAGRPSEAFSVFHALRLALSSELGIAPGAALQQLYEAMIRDSPSFELWLGERTPGRAVGTVTTGWERGASDLFSRSLERCTR